MSHFTICKGEKRNLSRSLSLLTYNMMKNGHSSCKNLLGVEESADLNSSELLRDPLFPSVKAIKKKICVTATCFSVVLP